MMLRNRPVRALFSQARCMSRRTPASMALENVLATAKYMEAHFKPELTEAELLGQALWRNIEQHQFKRVTNAENSLPIGEVNLHSSVVSAFMHAHGEMGKPWVAKNILNNTNITEVTPALLGFLLNGYVISDSLGSAERLMQSWMSCYISSHPEDKETIALEAFLRTSSASHKAKDSAAQTQQLAQSSIGKEIIPLSAWVAMLTMYGNRRAWQQCTHILSYLEHKRDTQGVYAFSRTNGHLLSENLDELMHPTYLVRTEYFNVSKSAQNLLLPNTNIQSFLRRGLTSENVSAVQWGSVYQLTLRALCEANQYHSAICVLKRMRQAGCAQVPAAIALLGALRSPLSHTTDTLRAKAGTTNNSSSNSKEHNSSGSDGDSANNNHNLVEEVQALENKEVAAPDVVRAAVEFRRSLAASLLPDVTAAVIALATPREKHTRLNRRGDVRNAAVDSVVMETDDRAQEAQDRVADTVNMLAKEYVLLLSKLDLLEECKVFISQVQAHIEDVRRGRKLPAGVDFPDHLSSAEGTNATEQQATQRYRAHGFWGDSWMDGYVRRLRETGRWAEADAFYSQLVNQERAHRATWAEDTGASYHSRKHHFHDVTAALRGAHQLDKLANMMEQHKVA